MLKTSKISSKLIDNPGEELPWCNFAKNSGSGNQPALGLMFKNSLNFMGKGWQSSFNKAHLAVPTDGASCDALQRLCTTRLCF